MPKELFLMRHAEAENSDYRIKDIERPLTSDGEIMASKVGKFLSKLIKRPDEIMCSPAVRTQVTSEMIAEQLQFNLANVEIKEELYEASTRILLRVINALDEKSKKVIIVAHNPSIPYLSEYLTGAEVGNIIPAGVVHLKFEGAWEEVSQGNVDLVHYYSPEFI